MESSQHLPFKISVLVFMRDESGRLLLIQRAKSPNKGLWSPIGGKLEMSLGESPFQCAARETREETGIDANEGDFHLFSMVSERAYEGGSHWLMFLFDYKKTLKALPENIDEGKFAFFDIADIECGKIPIPETDKVMLWDAWKKYRDGGFAVMRADCADGVKMVLEQEICPKNFKI